jgi:hypothetical protein
MHVTRGPAPPLRTEVVPSRASRPHLLTRASEWSRRRGTASARPPPPEAVSRRHVNRLRRKGSRRTCTACHRTMCGSVVGQALLASRCHPAVARKAAARISLKPACAVTCFAGSVSSASGAPERQVHSLSPCVASLHRGTLASAGQRRPVCTMNVRGLGAKCTPAFRPG